MVGSTYTGRQLASLMILLLLPLFFVNCGGKHKDHSPHLERGDTLRVGIELSPTTVSTMGDTIEGFSYDILNYLVAEHGFNHKLKGYSNMKEALDDLRKGHIDLLVSNLPLTIPLKEEFLATKPIYTDRIVLVQNIETDTSLVKYPHELAGKEVWAARETSVAERLRNLSDEIGGDIIINDSTDSSEEELLILVALGEIERAAVGLIRARALSEHYPQIDISTELSFSQFKCWLIAPGDSILCDTIDSWLDNFKEKPEFERLKQKYKIK